MIWRQKAKGSLRPLPNDNMVAPSRPCCRSQAADVMRAPIKVKITASRWRGKRDNRGCIGQRAHDPGLLSMTPAKIKERLPAPTPTAALSPRQEKVALAIHPTRNGFPMPCSVQSRCVDSVASQAAEPAEWSNFPLWESSATDRHSIHRRHISGTAVIFNYRQ